MTRAWFLAVPLLTVLVVSYVLLVAAVPRALVAARVYGGPTEGASSLALRVEVVRRDGESESPFWEGPITLHAEASGASRLTVAAPHATRGIAEVNLPFARAVHGPVRLDLVQQSGQLLARGAVSLDVERWAGRARRRGAWIRGRSVASLVVSVAPERGAFVVGSSDPLVVRVERAGSPVRDAQLTISAEGARLVGARDLQSDAQGRARFGFEPSELNPTLRIEARTSDGQSGLIDTGVPVVPGGMHGVRSGPGIRVESATPRAEAFFSVVSERRRVLGGVLSLQANGQGGSVALVDLPPLPEPAWLVLSSDVDLSSAATVGWPLDVSPEPVQTFDVPDVLLLDGMPAAFAREQARRSRVRWLCAAFIFLSGALSATLLVVHVQASDRAIHQHLSEGLDPEALRRAAPRRGSALLVALLAIGLGFVTLGVVVAARLR